MHVIYVHQQRFRLVNNTRKGDVTAPLETDGAVSAHVYKYVTDLLHMCTIIRIRNCYICV